jgi:pimeloyl-ACP methyl ester carboxylesterase
MEDPDLRTMSVASRRIAWREAGHGEALVLVHGIGGYSASWKHQLAAFAHRYRVVAWDAPGYGGSEPLTTETPSPQDYAETLAALLQGIGIEAAHFVGHSVGAVMIAALCRSRAITPLSAVLLHPVTGSGALPADQRETIRRARIADLDRLGSRRFAIERGRAILGRATPQAAVDEAMEVMAAVPQHGYRALWEMMCAADLFRDLDALTCPTLVLCGSDDPVSTEAACRTIAQRVPGAALKVFPGIGHYASIEAPDMFNAALGRFLAVTCRPTQ